MRSLSVQNDQNRIAQSLHIKRNGCGSQNGRYDDSHEVILWGINAEASVVREQDFGWKSGSQSAGPQFALADQIQIERPLDTPDNQENEFRGSKAGGNRHFHGLQFQGKKQIAHCEQVFWFDCPDRNCRDEKGVGQQDRQEGLSGLHICPQSLSDPVFRQKAHPYNRL